MPKEISYYTQKNLASWDEVAPRHKSINASLLDSVIHPDFNCLNSDFNSLVDSFGMVDKSVVQICCNNGIDLVSIKNKGAGPCLGIDGSSAFIDQAIELSKLTKHADLKYICSDVYDIPEIYHNVFDVAIITVGVLSWMPDISKFMQICSSLLVQGGVLLVEDLHPILGMYEEGEPSTIEYSYFNTQPYIDTNGLDYFTHEKYDAKVNYSFHHSLAAILMSAIAANLELTHIDELEHDVGQFCSDLELSDNNPPLTVNLAWQKRHL